MREKNSMRVVFSWYSGARKSAFRFSLCALLFALCSFTDAQQQGKLPKIGWLEVRPDDARTSFELFQRELRALSYVDGRNVVFEYRNAGNKLDRLPALADELVRLGVNLVFAVPAPAAVAAKNATTTIPIVFLGGFDPIAAGLVDSLARPGGNITGFSANIPMVAGKRLELLKETVPRLSRVAVLWNPQYPGSTQQWKESRHAAHDLGLQLHSMELTSAGQLDNAFKEAARAHITGLAIVAGSVATANPKLTTDLAIEHRLPAVFDRADYVTVGGLLSYGPDRADAYRRAAVMVDKVLKGTKPADIPVEQPTKFDFLINLKTAKALGLTIPQSLLQRADEVIQ